MRLCPTFPSSRAGRRRSRLLAGLELYRFLIRDEQVIRFISYWDRAAAFEALGLPARG